jgi:hypothetical protein
MVGEPPIALYDEIPRMAGLWRSILRQVLEMFVERSTSLLGIAHNLERTVDRITTIPERVIFMTTGQIGMMYPQLPAYAPGPIRGGIIPSSRDFPLWFFPPLLPRHAAPIPPLAELPCPFAMCFPRTRTLPSVNAWSGTRSSTAG